MLFSKDKKTPEQRFWGWFKENEQRIFSFEQDQERVFDEIQHELQKVNPALCFEVSSVICGKRHFVVSADGIRDAFESVKAVVDAAPTLSNWVFIKFRQRMYPLCNIEIGGIMVKASDIEVSLGRYEDNEKIALILFIPYIHDEQKLKQIGYLFLDQTLGEYDVETKVGGLRFLPFSDYPDYPRFPLQDLPANFDRFYQQINPS